MNLALHSLQSRQVIMIKDSKKEILGMTTISYKFQVTIPKKVREKYHLQEGETIMFVEENDKIYLAKSTDV
ncbi:MAG: AbrB/MazE/SpoVT family DNA-binding domain-containing protein [Nitrosotalea sp.]